jgi:hypothetical protein
MSTYLDELLDPQKESATKGSTLKNQLKVYREVEDKTKMLSELLQFRSDWFVYLILRIAIQTEQHHIEEKHLKIHMQTRFQCKYW